MRLLQERFPHISPSLLNTSCEELPWVETRQGEPNVRVLDGRRKGTLHSQYNALKDAERWFQNLELENVNVLYIYGIGLGYYYLAAKSWLKESSERYLVFLEDDPRILKRCLETDHAQELLEDGQVIIHTLDQDLDELRDLAHELTWTFVGLQCEVSALQYYQKRYLQIGRAHV